MTATYKPNFAGGIMSSGMYARTDVAKHVVGVKDAVNVVVSPQGGLKNRPGMRAIGADFGARGVPVLIPFEFSPEESYQLEFSIGFFRVIYMGGYILDTTWATKTGTVDNVGRIVMAGHGLTTDDIVQVSGVGLGQETYLVTAETAGNFTVGWVGQQPISGTEVTVQRAYKVAHPYAWSELAAIRTAQDANDLYLVHNNRPPHLIRRLGHANWTSAPVVFAPDMLPPSATAPSYAITATEANADPWVTVPGHALSVGDTVVWGSTTWDSTSAWGAHVRGVYSVTATNATQVKMRRVDGPKFDTTGLTFASLPPSSLSRVGIGLRAKVNLSETNPSILRYSVAAVNAAGEESTATVIDVVEFDLTAGGSHATPVWLPQPGAVRYVVYRQIAGGYGYIGTTTDTWFVDDNIAPDMSQGPQVARNPFEAAGDYPGVVAFHEQRLFFAATKNDPQRVDGSQSGLPRNFSVSTPPRPSDALSFRLRYRQVNAVRALVSGPRLILLTGGGEWLVSGSGDGVALTPDNIFLHPISYWGSDDIQPLLLGDVLSFVQRGGKIVRDYPLRGTAEEGRPTDLTIMSSELFTAPVASWAFAQTPDGIVWVALDDGRVLSLTYLAEHDVWGWTRHELGGGGRALQFSVTMEAGNDAVYAVVERSYQGAFIRRTERMDQRSNDSVEGLYLDHARSVRYTTDHTSADGFRYLAGRTVSAVVDGNVYENLTVTPEGGLTLPGGVNGGKLWIVGFPYTAEIETLPVDLGDVQGPGSMAGRYKRLNSVMVHVAATRGVFVGRDRDSLEELPEWGRDLTKREVQTKISPVTVQGDWVREASLVVRHPYPLPFALLALAPDWEFGT